MTSKDTHGPLREQEQLSSICHKQEHLLAHAILMHGILVQLPNIIAVTTSSSHWQEVSAQVYKPHSTRNTAYSKKKPQMMRPAALRHPLSRQSNCFKASIGGQTAWLENQGQTLEDLQVD